MDKKALISAIHRISNASLGGKEISVTTTNELLVLVTAAGQIFGTPLQIGHKLQKNNEFDPKRYAADTIFSIASELITEQGEDSFILLKDAVLRTSGEKTAYQYLYVFTDDVIAATVTNSYPE